MREPVPLAQVHDAILELLRGREDAVVFGAHAVNVYVDEPRMTQDVDVMSTCAPELAAELRYHLADRFGIAVRVREVASGRGHRVYQLRKPKNRHLADVRAVAALPPHRKVEGILVVEPAELICQKVISTTSRGKTPKGTIDMADLRRLLIALPVLKQETGPVMARLLAASASAEALDAWKKLVAENIEPDDEDGGY